MDCISRQRIKRVAKFLALSTILGFASFGVDAVARDDETARASNEPLILFDVESEGDVDAPKAAPTAVKFSEQILQQESARDFDPASRKPSLKEESSAETSNESSTPAVDVAATASVYEIERREYVEPAQDPALFPHLRPFKRARERFFGALSNAPNPPTVEQLDLESVVVVAAKPPVLSLESDALPPLDLDAAKAKDEEFASKADLDALRQETKDYMWKKGDLKITPYGFLNLAVSCDSERAVPGEYILYLQDPAVDSSSGFGVDARTSRLGLKIEGPRIEALDATLGGVAEFDFQGTAAGSKNKGGVQLRRAFAELVDAKRERRLLFGQDWEIISPGAPQMLNYLPGAFAGNIQYRRAQAKFEQGWTTSPDAHFIAQIGIVDDVLGDYVSTSGVYPASSGWPVVEGRLAVDLFKESRCGLPITLGVSGHIGEQYYTFSPISGAPLASTKERKAIETWSANFDATVPITQNFKLSGEYYQGVNLSSFCGGINQGVDLFRREAIEDKGWWASAHFDATKQLALNVGYGQDKPKGSDLVGTSAASGGIATARTKNEIYFTNAIYNWSANFMTGLEVSYWQTGYQKTDVTSTTPTIVSRDVAKSVRTEFVTRLTF